MYSACLQALPRINRKQTGAGHRGAGHRCGDGAATAPPPPTAGTIPQPQLLYLCPSNSNPAGHTLPDPARRALVRLAAEAGFFVVADEVYHYLDWHPGAGSSAVAEPSAGSSADAEPSACASASWPR